MSRIYCTTDRASNLKQVIKSVCDIKSVLITRSVFGHRCVIQLPIPKRVICNIYFTIIPILLIISKYYCCDGFLHVTKVVEIVEYLSYYIISFHTCNKYLTDYYRFDSIIDGSAYSSKVFSNFEKYLNFIVPTIVVSNIFYSLPFFLSSDRIRSTCGEWGIIIFVIYKVAVNVGRVPMVLVFSLLYCRVKIFSKDLMGNGFMTPVTSQSVTKKYLDMYISICNGIAKMDYPMKFMIFINICSYFLDVLWIFHDSIIVAAYLSAETNYMMAFATGTNLVYNGIFTFFPALILEIVTGQMEKNKIYIVDQIIACSDEQRRREMQELLQYIKSQPLSYSVWSVIPMTAKLPITALSLAINYIICMLQFTSAFGSPPTTFQHSKQ